MESLIGIIIFVAFAVLSAMAKSQANRDQQQRRQTRGQQWPGPVAGPRPGQGPGMPGFPGYPRPQFPQPQRQAPPPPPVRPALAPAPEVDTEGVGTEGPMSESAEAEVSRFDRETAQDIDSAVAEISQAANEIAREADAVAAENPTSRHIGQLAQEDYAFQVTGEVGGTDVRLDDLQQSVIMAEVLGRPKGARYFHRTR